MLVVLFSPVVRKMVLDDLFGTARLWEGHVPGFPTYAIVALRILAVPASSTPSEGDCSTIAQPLEGKSTDICN